MFKNLNRGERVTLENAAIIIAVLVPLCVLLYVYR